MKTHLPIGHRLSRLRLAIDPDGTARTGSQLMQRARELAFAWATHGVRPGVPVVIELPNDSRALVRLAAAERIDAPVIAAHSRWTAVERSRIARLAGASHTIGDDEVPVALTSTAAATPDLPKGAALVLFTSGTTDTPRGAILTLDSLNAAAEAACKDLSFDTSDVYLSVAPLYHVAGFAVCTLAALEAGASIRFLGDFDADRVAAALMDGMATATLMVPTMWERVADRLTRRARGLSVAITGGAPDAPTLAARLRARGVPLTRGYGTTEAGGTIAWANPAIDGDAYALGRPAHGVEVIAPPPGMRGELVVRTTSMARGLLTRAGVIPNAAVGTGDDVTRLDDGSLQWHGRIDDGILTGGELVDAHEVERALLFHPDVRDALVVGLPCPDWGQRVSAVVALARPCDPAALDAWLRRRIAAYKLPRRWAFIDEVPRSPGGKPDRAAALDLAQGPMAWAS